MRCRSRLKGVDVWRGAGMFLALALWSAVGAMAQDRVEKQIERERQEVEGQGFHLGRGPLDRALRGYAHFI